MKRLIVFLFFLFFAHILSSTFVDYEQALQVAKHQISVHEKTEYAISNHFKMNNENDKTLSYVFQLNPNGFIAVSSNTDIYPVIGYSFLNNFSVLDIPQNTGYQYLKNDMRLRLEAIPFTANDVKQANQNMWCEYLNGSYEITRNRNNIYPTPGYSPTEGWMDTQWHQTTPYNNFCPLDPETMQRSMVGCGATALAQILNYHKYIGDVNFDDSDDYVSSESSPSFVIDDDFYLYDFPSFSELNPYLDELKIAYEIYEFPTDDMVAALNVASGIVYEIQYSSGGSALIGYPSLLSLVYMQEFDYISSEYRDASLPDFYNILCLDMMEARPAYLRIVGPSVLGHLINCDGYNGNDDTYHLNMGWGGSSDGWYILPEEMPAGYSVISWGALNIEGGTIPFTVSGAVVCENAPLEETIITFDGPRYHEVYLEDESGGFNIPILFPGTYTVTASIELDEGGFFHYQEDVLLDENNFILIMELDDFSTITGTVSADINTENTHINIYSEDVLVSTGITDVNGNFSIPGLLPGEYTASASLNGNYFDSQETTITVENQTIYFQLEEYPYDFTFNFAGEPSGQLQLFQFMSCAIRLTGEDLFEYENDIFSRVEFFAPFSSEGGELYAQIWKNDMLLCEQQILEFTEGEWLEIVFENLYEIDTDAEYFIGYRIHSLSGNISAATHDDGPMIEGSGAYIYTSSWMQLPESYDVNFCIKGVIASQTSTSLSDENIQSSILNLQLSNHPNPFHYSTTISFQISNEQNQQNELIIYNLKGQKVKTLECNIHDIAASTRLMHFITWNGKDENGKSVNSGIYFYKLKSGKFEKMKRMLLLR